MLIADHTPVNSRSSAAILNTDGPAPWPLLIEKIKCDDASGMEDLYRVFSRGVRFFLWRQLGNQDLDDTVHDTFLIVAQAIREGELRDPERLMGFVWTVVRRQAAARIERSICVRKQHAEFDGAIPPDRDHDPEWAAIIHQRQVIVRRLLDEVPSRDREILVRFYLREQPQEEICREMELTDTQFRLLKSRAKARLEKLGRRKLGRRRICW